jgi:hypothetical protein
MENCAATDPVLPCCSDIIPSMSAEDGTAHQDSLLSTSLAFWRASEGLVVAKEKSDNG